MADNETSYLPIGTCLEQIEKAVYGREVRKAIHDGIAQCYDDTVEGVNAAQQAASDTQDVINDAIDATREANTAAAEASNVKVEQTVSGDTVTFTTTKRDGTTVSTSFQKPNIVVSKDDGSGEFSVTAKGWNGEEIVAKIPDPSEEVKSRANIAAVSKVKTALGNPLTITDGMDAPAVKTVVTLEPKQDLHGYDHPWVGGSGKNLIPSVIANSTRSGITCTRNNDGTIVLNGTSTELIDFYPAHESGMAVGKSGGFVVPAGTYSFGSVTGGSSTTYRAYLVKWIGSETTATYNSSANGEGTVTLSAEATIDFFVRVDSGVTLNNLVISPMVRLSSTESGYAPYSNICPIDGYDTVRVTAHKKNIFYTKWVQGSIRYSDGMEDSGSPSPTEIKTEGYIPVRAGAKYTISRSIVGGYVNLRLYDLQKVYIGTGSLVRDGVDAVTIYSGASKTQIMANAMKSCTLSFADYVGYIRLIETTNNLNTIYQMEEGETTTSYEEPGCSTTSLSVAQAAGATVYGGTVTLNEDGSGTLVVDRATVTEEAFIQVFHKTNNTNTDYVSTGNIGSKQGGYGLTNMVVVDNPNAWNVNYPVGQVASEGKLRFYGVFETAAAFREKYAGLQFTYELATPTTYTLTADQLRTLTGENHVWTDGTKLELTYRADKYADVEKFLNAIPTGTKTGDPAVFTDGADDLPFEKLTIAVEPHQEGSGDPSPDNVRPITGWDEVKVTRCGKNLLGVYSDYYDTLTVSGVTFTKIEGTHYKANGTSAANAWFQLRAENGQNPIPIHAPVGTYVSSAICSTGKEKIGSYIYYGDTLDASKYAVQTNVTLLNEQELQGVRYLMKTGMTFNNEDVYFQLECRNTRSEYETPYNARTLPISLKYATGSTVYGGTVTINRDGTGSVVVDRAIAKLPASGWQYEAANSRYYYSNVPNIDGSITRAIKFVCDKFRAITDGRNISQIVSDDCYIGNVRSNRNGDLYVHTNRYASLQDFQSAVKDVTIAHQIESPTTYTLTAPQLTSLLGNNTVWCDAGQVTVKYKKDIGKMISNLYALMVDTGVIVIENEEDVTVEGPHYNP